MSLVLPQDVDELKKRGWQEVDVRSRTEYQLDPSKRVNVVNVPLDEQFLATMALRFNKTDKLIVSSMTGRRSSRAVVRLAAAGYAHLGELMGGHQTAEALRRHQWATTTTTMPLPVHLPHAHAHGRTRARAPRELS